MASKAASSDGVKLLLTGGSGYIGGAVLAQLLSSSNAATKSFTITLPIRNPSQGRILTLLSPRVTTIPIASLDDTEILKAAAAAHDIVIHTASGFHPASAKALIEGLSSRSKSSGKSTIYIHTTGTSNLGDRPISGTYHESRIFDDRAGDIATYLAAREAIEPYPQRTTDLTVLSTTHSVNASLPASARVKSYLLMSPTIYGISSGPLNKTSIQIPTLIRSALAAGQAQVIASGTATWDAVHISELAELYERLLLSALDRDRTAPPIPEADRGIYFASTSAVTPRGSAHSWRDLAHAIGDEGHARGALDTAEVREIGLGEAAVLWTGGDAQLAELGFASRARTVAGLAVDALGWNPKRVGREALRNGVREDWGFVLAERNVG